MFEHWKRTLHGLSLIDTELPARHEAKMAFYINAYNARTIRGILHEHLGYVWSLNDQCPTVGVKLTAIPYRAYSIASPALKPFKDMASRGDSDFQTAASCDSCDAASCQVPELVPFAPYEIMTDTIPGQL